MILLLLLLCLTTMSHCDPEVTLDQGILKGKVLTSRKGRNIFTFQGIPYAKPPVRDLRFKPPEEADSWDGVRLAQSEGSECAQHDWIARQCVGAEDCLFINVYTPQLGDQERPGLTVMVWIYGGGFNGGSGNTKWYSPELLLDHDVILVTFNYRLGALGFLNLGTTEAPGNYGLKDQVAALRWVKKNVDKFGGNPESVTIFGESAGGASVHYLMLSPLARGLFQRSIMQSGSAFNFWALLEDPGTLSRHLARKLGCEDEDSMLPCLRDIEYSLIINTSVEIMETHGLAFVPSIEMNGTNEAFLSEAPRAIHSRGGVSDVPLMAGLVTHESMYQLLSLSKANISAEEALTTTDPSSFVPTFLNVTSNEKHELGLEIIEFYRNLYPNNTLEQFIQLKSDISFASEIDETVSDMSTMQQKNVFYYLFTYDGKRGVSKKTFNSSLSGGTAHMDELGYMFEGSQYPDLQDASSEDLLVIDHVTKLWTNFAKTGNPTPDNELGVQWRTVSASINETSMVTTRYLDIGEQLIMKESNLKSEQLEFWHQLRQRYGIRVGLQ